MSFYADCLSSLDSSLKKYPEEYHFMIIDVLVNHLDYTDYNQIEDFLKYAMEKVSLEIQQQIQSSYELKQFLED